VLWLARATPPLDAPVRETSWRRSKKLAGGQRSDRNDAGMKSTEEAPAIVTGVTIQGAAPERRLNESRQGDFAKGGTERLTIEGEIR